MKDEIKEILDNIKEDINGKFEWEYIDGYYVEQIKPLLDYITNLQTIEKEYSAILSENAELQQELEEEKRIEEADLKTIQNLEEENERLKEWKEDLLKENIELENIRKEVIEYLEQPYRDNFDYSKVELLNILQGENNGN